MASMREEIIETVSGRSWSMAELTGLLVVTGQASENLLRELDLGKAPTDLSAFTQTPQEMEE